MGEESYDDQFNDGLFRATATNSARQRPKQWPKSVSEMRGRTDYGNQGMSPNWDTAMSNFSTRRPYNQQQGLSTPTSKVATARQQHPQSQQSQQSQSPRQAPMPWQRGADQFYMPFWRDLSSPKNQGW